MHSVEAFSRVSKEERFARHPLGHTVKPRRSLSDPVRRPPAQAYWPLKAAPRADLSMGGSRTWNPPLELPFHRGGLQDALPHALRILQSRRLPPRWPGSLELRSSNPRAYPGRLGSLHGCFEFGTHSLHRRARRSRSAILLRIQAGTILPSGPRATIASFGTPEGHSYSVRSRG